ncbi:MAG TPA: hypothetical protein VFK05_14215 [Polyangiaceae bacterium]|nr:hypothetical protein [Polyangiaceae bacterium]
MARANHFRPPWRQRIAAAAAARLRWQCVLLCLVALNGCADNASGAGRDSEAQVWVGEVAGSDVAVGIVASAQRSTLFFCGGDSTYPDHTHWFLHQGPLSQTAPLEDGRFRVTLSAVGERVEGNLEIEGFDSASFSTELVKPRSLAGVYDALVPCGHAGLIVRQSAGSAAPAAQGTCVTTILGDTVVEQVNPVMPVALGADSGISASTSDAPSEMFTLRPLVLAGN